jgi:tetrahydromethanopterin S-methyltransferase subunit E
MAFKDIFKDSNDFNEKSIVGFASFAVMVIFAAADIITGFLGNPLVIEPIIFNSFVYITLGAFGIAEVGKIFGKKEEEKQQDQEL